MIARLWTAKCAPERTPAYVEHLTVRVLPELKKLVGYGGAMLLQRPVSGAVEVVVLTFWQSLEAIRSFAGVDLENAMVADEAAALLTQFDRRVRHYEVAVMDGLKV